jgi:alkylation response protein AidB-like acyl-CoA dehydrogenase
MAKTKKAKDFRKLEDPDKYLVAGPEGAIAAAGQTLTTDQGVLVGDNQNTLKSKEPGPSQLEDFAFHEKKPSGRSYSIETPVTESGTAPASGEVIPLLDERASSRRRLLQARAREVGEKAFVRADHYDEDGAFPTADLGGLHESGLLRAVLPIECGGAGLSGLSLSEILRSIGSGNLPLGRLFEGHVNALELVLRCGSRDQIELVAEEVQTGKLFGVWNTDDSNGLRLIDGQGCYWLEGRKILASGAGHIERPLVTATDENGRRLMVLPKLRASDRADLSSWRAQGMRASATGAVDFTGVEIQPIEIVGRDGDYERQPWFSAGAWRFAAVHLGGMERLFDLLRRHLQETNRGQDPHQAARLGGAAMPIETARLWVAQAATITEAPLASRPPEQLVAYVNLARLAVEAAALDLMQLVQRSVGLQAFLRPNPIERISRDPATYLRQPGPDRALTDAAAWVLAQPVGAQDLWR